MDLITLAPSDEPYEQLVLSKVEALEDKIAQLEGFIALQLGINEKLLRHLGERQAKPTLIGLSH